MILALTFLTAAMAQDVLALRSLEGGALKLAGVTFVDPPDIDAPISCTMHLGIRWTWEPPVIPISKRCPPEIVSSIEESMKTWTVPMAQRSATTNGFLTIPVELTAQPGVDGQPSQLRLTLSPVYNLTDPALFPPQIVVDPPVYLTKGSWPRFRKHTSYTQAKTCEVTAQVTPEGTLSELKVERCDALYHSTVEKTLGRWVFSPYMVDSEATGWPLSLTIPIAR